MARVRVEPDPENVEPIILSIDSLLHKYNFMWRKSRMSASCKPLLLSRDGKVYWMFQSGKEDRLRDGALPGRTLSWVRVALGKYPESRIGKLVP